MHMSWEAFSSLADVPFQGYHPVLAVESVILPVAVAVARYEYQLVRVAPNVLFTKTAFMCFLVDT